MQLDGKCTKIVMISIQRGWEYELFCKPKCSFQGEVKTEWVKNIKYFIHIFCYCQDSLHESWNHCWSRLKLSHILNVIILIHVYSSTRGYLFINTTIKGTQQDIPDLCGNGKNCIAGLPQCQVPNKYHRLLQIKSKIFHWCR